MPTVAQANEIRIVRELAHRTLMGKNLMYYIKSTHPNYLPGWVHVDICERLEKFVQAVLNKESPRLMLLVPPRGGKSEIASVRMPAWVLGNYPALEMMNLGYNQDLPLEFSRQVRAQLQDKYYHKIFPHTRINPSNRAADAWKTTKRGGLVAAGVGGPINGKGADILIIDDPIKNIEEADSFNTREKLEQWFFSTAYSRLSPGAGVLLVQTWWHFDDLAGRLLQHMEDKKGDTYEVIRYPAIAESYEYREIESRNIIREDEVIEDAEDLGLELLREPGEALHPERFPIHELERIRSNQPKRIWSALYQQSPVPDTGSYFQEDQIKLLNSLPDPTGRTIITTWDFAIGLKQHNDWTVGTTTIMDESHRQYICEVKRFRGGTFEIVRNMCDTAEKWRRVAGSYTVGVEDGQLWKALTDSYKRECQERDISSKVTELNPFTDKAVRARPLQGRMEKGMIYFLRGATWLNAARKELLQFPAGIHDDFVDALAWNVRVALTKVPMVLDKRAIIPLRRADKGHMPLADRLKMHTKMSGGDGSFMSA
jgi:predicted phage terminase large subunit-like protein